MFENGNLGLKGDLASHRAREGSQGRDGDLHRVTSTDELRHQRPREVLGDIVGGDVQRGAERVDVLVLVVKKGFEI